MNEATTKQSWELVQNSRFVGLVLFLASVSCNLAGCGGSSSPDRVKGTKLDNSSRPSREIKVIDPVGPNGLDVTFASDLFMGAIIMHPKQALNSGEFEPATIEGLLAGFAGENGIPIDQCRRVSLYVPSISPQAGDQTPLTLTIFEFEESVDVETLLSDSKIEFAPIEHPTQTIFAAEQPNLTLFLHDDSTVVVGPTEFVENWAKGRPPRLGRLAEILGGLELQADMLGAFNGAAVQGMVGSMGAVGSAGGGADMPTALEFNISLSGDELVVVRVEADSEAQASEVEANFGQALAMFRQLMPMMKGAMSKGVDLATRRLLEQFLNDVVTGTSIVKEGSEVKIKVARPNNLGPALNAIARNMLLEERRLRRQARMTNVAAAAAAYIAEHQSLPADTQIDENDPSQGLSWRVELLPMLGYQELYDRFDLDASWDSPANLSLLAEIPDEFKFDEGETKTRTLRLSGSGTLAADPTGAISPEDVSDGAEQTLWVVEVSVDAAVEWTRPTDVSYLTTPSDDPGEGEPNDPSEEEPSSSSLQSLSLQSLGDEPDDFINVIFADGQFTKLPRSTTSTDFDALVSPAGGEAIDIDRVLGRGGFPGFGGGFNFGF